MKIRSMMAMLLPVTIYAGGINPGTLAVGGGESIVLSKHRGSITLNDFDANGALVIEGYGGINKNIRRHGRNINIYTGGKNIVFPKNTSWRTQSGYHTVFQDDGNFVVYNPRGKPVWHSSTYNKGATHLVMQKDGNLVIYNARGKALWASGTHRYHNAFLAIQNDGNVVIYTPQGRAAWSTRTNGK